MSQHSLLAAMLPTLTMLVGACGGDETEQAEDAPTAGTTGETAGTACEDVSRATVKWLESGLTVSGGGQLKDAQAVRSGDYERVYFISARITGSGMGNDTIGTWAKSGNVNSGEGLVLSVDTFAKEFSDWFPGDKEGAEYHVTMEDDGAEALAGVPE
jgi:hypothetical protein